MSKKKEESKEVAIVETTKELAAPIMANIESQNGILASMLKLARLSVMQKMSKQVEEEKAKIGELVENLSNTVVCPKDTAFEFVALKVNPVLTKYKQDGDKYLFESREPLTPINEGKNFFECVEDNIKKRFRSEIEVYLIPSSQLEDPFVMPMIFTFRGASMPKGGKSMYTYASLLNKNLSAYFFVMTNKKEVKGTDSFQVAYIDKPVKKVSNPVHIETINNWKNTLHTAKVEADEEHLEAAPIASEPTQF